MNSLYIENDILSIKSVEPKQLYRVLEWYNRSEDYSYATGNCVPLTLEKLGRDYFGVLHSKTDIFLGVHIVTDSSLIGMLKCRISGNVLWIYSFIIDKHYQSRGHGTMTLSMLLYHLKSMGVIREVLLSVAGENSRGRNFWLKNGFREIKLAKSKKLINGKENFVIIMKKDLF